jgi:hypothetical protein
MMAVDDVRSFRQDRKVVRNAYAVSGQIPCERANGRSIYDDVMLSLGKTEREVPDNDFRTGSLREPNVGDENAQ